MTEMTDEEFGRRLFGRPEPEPEPEMPSNHVAREGSIVANPMDKVREMREFSRSLFNLPD